MKAECKFSRSHPLVLLLWFLSALTFTVVSINPVFAAFSFSGALLHRVVAAKKVSGTTVFTYMLFMAAIAVLNPLFSHHGVTVLFFVNDLPITWEAFCFGVYMAFSAAAALIWCGVLSCCMTSDKIIYLVGKPFPKLAVLISLSLRLIPMLREQYKRLEDAQKAIGTLDDGSLINRVRSRLQIYSVLVTIMLEDSIDISDSMKARGIELAGRRSYSEFRFRLIDVLAASLTCISAIYLIYGAVFGMTEFSFYPAVSSLPVSAGAIASYAAFGILIFIPTLTEVILWKR